MHQDLTVHPKIECGQKELNALTLATRPFTNRKPSDVYQWNFRSADQSSLRGDVSTTYTMEPDYPDVAKRAKEVIGDELKIIYIVRNPVQRTISHHQYMMNQANGFGPDINEEIDLQPSLIQYSLYAMQIKPWLACFERENFLFIKFEEYVAAREATMKKVYKFLGVDNIEVPLIETGVNRTGTARVARPGIQQIYRSEVFQKIIRPLTPNFIRNGLRHALTKKTAFSKISPTIETINKIIEGVREDMIQFQTLAGWSACSWDLDAFRQNT